MNEDMVDYQRFDGDIKIAVHQDDRGYWVSLDENDVFEALHLEPLDHLPSRGEMSKLHDAYIANGRRIAN